MRSCERLRSGALKLLYVAPERFNNERFLAQLARTRISLFAVDEAHCISEWGHNFRPDYLKLAERARELAAERVLALTATATPAVVADIRAGFGIEEADAVVTGFYRPNLTLLLTPVAAGERDGLLLERLRERPPGSTIVYVTLQRTALRVAELLVEAGLPARPYHAGMSTEERVARAGVVVGLVGGDRGRDDRVRDGDRQGGRPLRLPLQPAEGPRVVLAGDRAGRTRRRGEHLRAASPARTTCPRSRTSPMATRPRGRRSPACSPTCSSIPWAPSSPSPNTSSPCATTCARSCSRPHSRISSSTASSDRARPSTRATGSRPTGESFDEVFGRFDESRAGFLRRLIASGKTGRTWTTIAPDEAASALGEERSRIVAALEYLDQQGLVELQAAEVRQRYTVTARPDSQSDLVEQLLERFARRERSETERIQNVLSLVTHDGCQVQALVAYFGETRTERCGHCSHCLTGRAPAAPRARAEAADRDDHRRRGPGGSARRPTRTRSERRGKRPASSPASPAPRRPARS